MRPAVRAGGGVGGAPTPPQWEVPGGDARRGKQAIGTYGCGSCHTIGGLHTATGRVGPRLLGLREQAFIAGRLSNVPHHLVEWIRSPREIDPGTAMPDLGVTEADAKDIAAYL